jgi:hypothetical protein
MSIIEEHVDKLFAEAERLKPRGQQNPVTGDYWLANVVPVGPEKRNAKRALLAREFFAAFGPPDAPPLPLNDVEIELYMNWGAFAWAIALYAVSLRSNDWDLQRHPNFEQFVAGLLHLRRPPLTEAHLLARRFPPRPLSGLSEEGVWHPVH